MTTIRTNTGQTFEIPEHYEETRLAGADLLESGTFARPLSPTEIDDGTADALLETLLEDGFDDPDLVEDHGRGWELEAWAVNQSDVDSLRELGFVRVGR